ncbi:MAG: M20/M25/M40 family metallo-hydrolase [Cyclobacteriaceae bacterium]|nr:M20/M25/M40 family metallo-hydrolase [Cyclobacteriaceae bacterium]
MKAKLFILVFLYAFSSYAQTEQEIDKALSVINEQTLKAQMNMLASDWMEGRETGTKGAYLSADYIASIMQYMGLQPAGDFNDKMPGRMEMLKGASYNPGPSYFQPLSLIKYKPADEQSLRLLMRSADKNIEWQLNYKTDFDVAPSDLPLSARAGVVFGGYGVQEESLGIDDFKDLPLKGKILMRIAGMPGDDSAANTAGANYARTRFSIDARKNEAARKFGAIAVIELNLHKDISIHWAGNVPFRYNYSYYEGDDPLPWTYDFRLKSALMPPADDIPVFRLSKRMSEKLIKELGIQPEVLYTNTKERKKNPKSQLPFSAEFSTMVKSEIIECRNVLGMIEGEITDEVIVIGAHYDHLGKYNGIVWNGADDNASGTVGVLSIARAIQELGIKPKRTLIFAAWTAEEKGLIGSRYFVDQFGDQRKIVAALNYDMISRNSQRDSVGRQVSLVYSNALDKTRAINDEFNSKHNLNLEINYSGVDKPSGGSDHSSFSRVGVPVLWYFTGLHEDYHMPSDHAEKINWDKFTRIVQLGFLNIWHLAQQE